MIKLNQVHDSGPENMNPRLWTPYSGPGTMDHPAPTGTEFQAVVPLFQTSRVTDNNSAASPAHGSPGPGPGRLPEVP